MKKKYGESGSTLIIVLISITLLMTIGTVILSQSITTAKQKEKTESIYRATHIAEMGVTYVMKKVEGYVDENPPTENLAEYVTEMFNEVDKQVDQYVIDSEHPNRKFSLDQVDISIDNESGAVKATFTIVGMDERDEEAIKATVEINGLIEDDESGNKSIEDYNKLLNQPDSGETFDEKVEWKKNEQIKFDTNIILNNGGYLKNSKATVNGDIYSDEDFTFDSGSGELKVCGNSVFTKQLSLKTATFHTNGSVYVKDGLNIENGESDIYINQDFILDVGTNTSSIGESASIDIHVNGNLVFLNVKEDRLLEGLKNTNIKVVGDVYVYYQGKEEPVINPNGNFTPEIKEYNVDRNKKEKGTIIYHYPNQADIFIDGCSQPNNDQGKKQQKSIVEITNVEY